MNTSIDYISSSESPRERVPRELAGEFEAFRTDPDILELIARLSVERGSPAPDPTENEASFMNAVNDVFDFRKGKKREELEGGDLSQEVKDLAAKLVEKYGMKRNTEPSQPDADAILVLGGAGVTPRTRLDYVLDLEAQDKLRAPTLVMVGGERVVPEDEAHRAGESGYNFAGEPAGTEFDLMRNTVAKKLDIADEAWEHYDGDDPTIPHDEHGFQTRWRLARTEKDGQEILVTSAPMIDTDRFSHSSGKPRNRANTIDSILFAARILRMGKIDGGRFAVVTNAVFVPFQGADSRSGAAPYDIEIDTFGMNREYSGLSEWQNGDIAYYIQEMLSTIRSTQSGRDRLAKT